MNELMQFNFNGQQIRTVTINGEPWFVAKDIADILDYSQTEIMTRRLDVDEVIPYKIEGMNMISNLINESGLYNAILGSSKPSAKEFKKKVTNEILPSIRKHGAYMTPAKLEEVLLNPDTLIRLATDLKVEREQRRLLQEKIESEKQYTDFGKIINDTPASILIGDYAKILTREDFSIGRNRLFAWFIENKYLYRDARSNIRPYQQFVEQGLFEVKENSITNSKGSLITITTKITGKGQLYFADKILPVAVGE